jgi:hypothetical protein
MAFFLCSFFEAHQHRSHHLPSRLSFQAPRSFLARRLSTTPAAIPKGLEHTSALSHGLCLHKPSKKHIPMHPKEPAKRVKLDRSLVGENTNKGCARNRCCVPMVCVFTNHQKNKFQCTQTSPRSGYNNTRKTKVVGQTEAREVGET